MISRLSKLMRMTQPHPSNTGLLWGHGDTVPTNGDKEYATGCLWLHTDGGAGDALYVNEGTNTSCDFNIVESPGTLTLADLADVADAFPTRLVETGTYSSLAGAGVALSVTNTRPASFLFDDNGEVLASADYRPLLARTLLTVDQTENITINSVRGQLKLLDCVDISAGVLAGVCGYFEFAGTSARSISSHVAAVRAAIEEGASGTTTIAASSYYAGLECTLNSSRVYTVTGDMAGVVVNVDGGTSKWPEGILIVGPDVTKGMRIGKFADSAATTSAVLFATAQNVYADGQLDVLEVHGATTGDLTAGYSAKCARLRHVINAGDATVAQETYGGVGQLVVRSATLSHLHAGLMGTFEGHTEGVVLNSSYDVGHAAVIGRIGGHAAITATTPLAGFLAFNNASAEPASGLQVAFAAANVGATYLWDSLLYASGCDAILYVASATDYEDGVKAVTKTPTGNTSHVIKISIGGTKAYIPCYDDEACNADD